jgi:hypothetical protein
MSRKDLTLIKTLIRRHQQLIIFGVFFSFHAFCITRASLLAARPQIQESFSHVGVDMTYAGEAPGTPMPEPIVRRVPWNSAGVRQLNILFGL